MKKVNPLIFVVLLFLTTIISSCSAITGIFNAGMGVGIFMVIAILVVIAVIIMKINKK